MGEYDAIALAMTLAILSSTAVAISWMFLRRRASPGDKSPSSGAERRRERIEQAVDAMAIEIEVERISEGQRFLNKLIAGREQDRVPLSSTPNAERGA